MKCEKCGSKYTAKEGEDKCPFCGHIPVINIGAPEQESTNTENMNSRGDNAWERRTSWLDVSAMLEMIRGVLLDPVTTFRRMKLFGDLGSPLLFAVILNTIGMLGALFWNMMTNSIWMFSGQKQLEELAVSTGFMIGLTIFSPVLVLIGIFITSGILHVCLLITGGEKNGFEATLRLVAYATGATAPFQLIPFCGGLIGGIWAIVAQVIGAREMHETTTGKALLAVLLPLIFCCGCALVITFFGIGAGILAGMAGR